MIEILLWAPGIAIMAAMGLIYSRSRDPLHPIMYIGPMLFYVHVLVPLSLYYQNALEGLFPEQGILEFAQVAVVLEIAALCVGLTIPRVRACAYRKQGMSMNFSPLVRRRMKTLSYVLGGLGLTAYFYRLSTVGGFFRAYSYAKGGAASGVSGYITGGSLLTIPAIILLVLSRREKKLDFRTAGLMLLFIIPHLFQGLLGGSRGNAFLALTALLVSWYLARSERPSLRQVFAALLAIGVIMFFLKTHRREFYLGAENTEIHTEKVVEAILPSEVPPSHVTPLTWAVIAACHHNNMYYWGRRYGTQLFVRPIPRQLWPTKYEDLGLGWMVDQPGSAGMTPYQWVAAIGWFPSAGSAIGIIGDTFLEMSWGGILICFLIGLLYSTLWKNAITRHGIWTIIYFEACVVSVYLPTQGLATSWMYRFLYLAVPSIILWRVFFAKQYAREQKRRPDVPPKIVPFVIRAMKRDPDRRLRP